MKAEMPAKILVIDDDPLTCRLIASAIGIDAGFYASGRQFRVEIPQAVPLGVFLDINLGKDDSGLDLIPVIRGIWPYVPILVITSDSDADYVGKDLVSGANDFVRKPVNVKEIAARFRARSAEMIERTNTEQVTCGDVLVNTRMRFVAREGKKSYLSGSNIELLLYLIKSRGTLVSRSDLRTGVWGDLKVSDNAVDKKLFEVRRALKDISSTLQIQTLYGEGIKLIETNTSLSA